MAYKDKDRQREAQRQWVRQKRADQQGSTHIKIDHEGRQQVRELLDSWADGNGTEQQQAFGTLGRQYTVIKKGLTPQRGGSAVSTIPQELYLKSDEC